MKNLALTLVTLFAVCLSTEVTAQTVAKMLQLVNNNIAEGKGRATIANINKQMNAIDE